MIRLALLGVLSLLAFPSFAGLDERIQVSIEEPVQGERYSGISNLRGWAVSPEGTGNFYHQVFIDGDFAFYMSPYGNRADVGNAFPDYPDSDTAGFSMAFNYKDLAPGEHEIKVRAFDNASNYNEAVTTFTTERFESTFIASDSDVDLSGLDNVFLYDDQALLLNGANVEGKRWNFLLKWDKPSQSFKIWGIEGYTGDLSYSTGYEIAGSDSSGSANPADCDPAVDFCGNDASSSDSSSSSSDSSSSSSSSGDDASCDPSYDFGCQSASSDSGTSSDSGDGAGTTVDCANITGYNPNCSGSSGSSSGTTGETASSDDCDNVTGYNPNCSDSSGSGDSGSSSGSGENSSGSTGYTTGSTSSGSDSGDGTGTPGTPDPGYVCWSSYDRCVYDYSSEIDIGNSGTLDDNSSFRITIPERTVAVVGLSISQNGDQEGRITFGQLADWTGVSLSVWISESPDGASVSDSCRYRGYSEGSLRFSLDGSRSCSLGAGAYFVNFAVCSSESEDWACSFDGAVMNDQDLEMILQSRFD